jgi:hypothetical protein
MPLQADSVASAIVMRAMTTILPFMCAPRPELASYILLVLLTTGKLNVGLICNSFRANSGIPLATEQKRRDGTPQT